MEKLIEAIDFSKAFPKRPLIDSVNSTVKHAFEKKKFVPFSEAMNVYSAEFDEKKILEMKKSIITPTSLRLDKLRDGDLKTLVHHFPFFESRLQSVFKKK